MVSANCDYQGSSDCCLLIAGVSNNCRYPTDGERPIPETYKYEYDYDV